MEALRTFSTEQGARDEFAKTRLRSDPTPGTGLEFTAPQKFASEKARRNFEENSPVLKAERAAQRGVDVRSGINPAIRAKVGLLNFNPETAVFVLDELVRQGIPEGEVPKGVPAVANIEGIPSALTRQEDDSYRYHAIDPVGLDSGDLAEFAGELPQIAAEIAGGIGGAAAGAPAGPAGMFLSGTAGAGVGSGLGIWVQPPHRSMIPRKERT